MNLVDFVDVLIFSLFEFVDDFVLNFTEEILRRRVDDLLHVSNQLRRHNVDRKWRRCVTWRRRQQLWWRGEGDMGKVVGWKAWR